MLNRIEEVKKIIKTAITAGRNHAQHGQYVPHSYIDGYVSQICQLFPQPLIEPKPPYCICCEYMSKCSGDPQKPSYCPDPKYSLWLMSSIPQPLDGALLTPEEIGKARDLGIKVYLADLPPNYDDYLEDKDGYKRCLAGEVAIAKAQLAKLCASPQPLDDEGLREKWKATVMNDKAVMPILNRLRPAGIFHVRQLSRDFKRDVIPLLEAQAKITWDKAFALLPPKIEKARRQERERIIRLVEEKSTVIDWEDDELGVMREMKEADWQALSSKGGESR